MKMPLAVTQTYSTHNHPQRYWETIAVGPEGLILTTHGTTREEAEANARFIVRVCNSHEQLLAALKWCVAHPGECLGDHPNHLANFRSIAEAAAEGADHA